MRISDWSSDVCSADRDDRGFRLIFHGEIRIVPVTQDTKALKLCLLHVHPFVGIGAALGAEFLRGDFVLVLLFLAIFLFDLPFDGKTVTIPARSEEHTSDLPSLMRISYSVFCLKKKTNIIY